MFSVGDVYIDGVTVNDINNGEGFALVFFNIMGFRRAVGFGRCLPLTSQSIASKPDKKGGGKQNNGEREVSPAPAHRVSCFLLPGQWIG
jgi:hypothetical protein